MQTLTLHTNRIVLLLFYEKNGIIPPKEAVTLEQTFLTELLIKRVRHLHDIRIPLSKSKPKNLILTGKNGSGKTSVLEALANDINLLVAIPAEVWDMSRDERKKQIVEYAIRQDNWVKNVLNLLLSRVEENPKKWAYFNNKLENEGAESAIPYLLSYLESLYVDIRCGAKWKNGKDLYRKYQSGQFILAFYGDSRRMEIDDVDHIAKVNLKPIYGMKEKPSKELGKYLADLEFTKSIALSRNNTERSDQIDEWFTRFENILRRIYSEPSLKLDFNIDSFEFSILIDGKEPFDFNTMSMGYAAVFDIVADLMMRMESQRRYDLEGIVLIDEIETHLHVELQKQIVPILTELFPNIQFILTTHSPFILSSAPNAVIYDLEKHMLVKDGMEKLSYEGIVEGYFEVDRFSQKLRKYFEEYKQLVTSENLSDLDYARIAELEDYLDEVPDYLSLDFAHEYSRLKAEFDN